MSVVALAKRSPLETRLNRTLIVRSRTQFSAARSWGVASAAASTISVGCQGPAMTRDLSAGAAKRDIKESVHINELLKGRN